MAQKILIVNYGVGNLYSVYRKLEQMHADVEVSNTQSSLQKADKVILPGIGHFRTAMEALNSHSLLDELNEFALVKKKPILGICLGMQIMAEGSEEANGKAGLGWIKGQVRKIGVTDAVRYKVPHVGWERVKLLKQSRLFKNIDSDAAYYFTHSYHYALNDVDHAVSTTTYAQEFVSAVESENIFGVQFHPEKSHHAGAAILGNFLDL
jgi:imidazole glycerol-phosphate synthase subunit HisH